MALQNVQQGGERSALKGARCVRGGGKGHPERGHLPYSTSSWAMAPPPTLASLTRGCSEASPWSRRWPERDIAAEQPRGGETMAGCVQEVSHAAYNIPTCDSAAAPPPHSGGGVPEPFPRAGVASHTRRMATRVLTKPTRYGSPLAWDTCRARPLCGALRHDALTCGCLPVAGTAGTAALGTLAPDGRGVVCEVLGARRRMASACSMDLPMSDRCWSPTSFHPRWCLSTGAGRAMHTCGGIFQVGGRLLSAPQSPDRSTRLRKGQDSRRVAPGSCGVANA